MKNGNQNNSSNNEQSNTVGNEDKDNTEDNTEEPQKPVEIKKEFVVTSKREKWQENLNIFNNEKYNGKPIIYPGISNTYYFETTNKLDFDVVCKISFVEENKENLPIKYKLKQNGFYIKGDSKNYVSYNELNIKDIILKSNSENVYELEWKWIDDEENDNRYGDIGKTIKYQLKVTVEAEEKIK